MNRLCRGALLLGLLLLGVVSVQPAAAQGCDAAILRIETTLPVDQGAICDAAAPLAAEGYQLFIYITDEAPASEEAWFALLDQVEQEAGLAQGQALSTSALALELSTADLPYAATLTYGERLFNSAVDNASGADRIKAEMRGGVAAGRPGDGIVAALEQSAELLGIGSGAPAPVTVPVTPAPPAGDSNLLELLGLGGLALGGAAGAALLPRYRRRRELGTRLEDLEARVPLLLGALVDLLGGDRPEEATLFEVLQINGGPQHPQWEAAREWIAASQTVLDQAVEIHSGLTDAAQREKLSLEERIESWELLAATLIGRRPQIRALTDDELRDLLDPWVNLVPGDPSPLVRQLDSVRQRLSGAPLKFDLTTVDEEQIHPEGVLGYVARIDGMIESLQQARAEAAPLLEQRRDELDRATKEFPDPFEIGRATLLTPIEGLMEQAGAAIEAGRHYIAVQFLNQVGEALEALQFLIDRMGERDAALDEAAAIYAAGFEPPARAADAQEVAAQSKAVAAAAARIVREPDALRAQAESLREAARTQAAHAVAWRALHLENEARRAGLEAEIQDLLLRQRQEAEPRFAAISQLAPSNWRPLAAPFQRAAATLKALQASVLPQAAALNEPSQRPQRFDQARALLDDARAQAEAAASAIEAVIARFDQIERLRESLPVEIDRLRALAAGQQERATRHAHMLPLTIGPEVATLHQLAEEARRLAAGGEYISAARRLQQGQEAGEGLVVRVDQAIEQYAAAAREAQRAWATAASSIREAGRLVEHMFARGAGRMRLSEARRLMPDEITGRERIQALEAIVERAAQAAAVANQAAREARETIALVERQRQVNHTRVRRHRRPSMPGGVGFPRSSRTPSRSRPSSSRSGSSFGSSRRSSSMGSRGRSSGSGGRRRR